MGTWSAAFYSDDLVLDIRNDYGNLLKIGKEPEAEKLMIEYYYKQLEDNREEASLFWIALAVAEWKKGRLSDKVLKCAIEQLDNGSDLERFRNMKDPNLVHQREKVLAGIRAMLLSPQPSPKKVSIKNGARSPWPEGSFLAYKICLSDDLSNHPLFGKYALIRIAKIDRDPISRIIPSAAYDEELYLSLYGWIGDSIPEPSVIQQLKPIPFYVRQPLGLVDGIRKASMLCSQKNSTETIWQCPDDKFEEYCVYMSHYNFREMRKAATLIPCDTAMVMEKLPSAYTQITTCTIVNPNVLEHRMVHLLLPFYTQ